MRAFRFLALALACALAFPAAAQVTVTRPTIVNPTGVPLSSGLDFILNADGTLAQLSGPPSQATDAIVPVVASLSSGFVAKATPGNVFSFEITTGATPLYVYGFNSTTVPANGAVTAGTANGNYQFCRTVAATTSAAFSYEVPERYSVGVSLAVSSTACGTLTKDTSAVFLKARVR